MAKKDISARTMRYDWPAMERHLSDRGFARLPDLLHADECRRLRASYSDDGAFRKRIDMKRHGFGDGTYAYFAAPLPDLVSELRTSLYEKLAPAANGMQRALRRGLEFPDRLADYTAQCHDAGQNLPTPLLLHYRAGGYNRLHQDLYGDLVFPFQVAVCLSTPGEDYQGGEFLLVENIARRQARGDSIALSQGEDLIFCVRDRAAKGARGPIRATMRHGVSPVLRGERYALGIIFHDAK